MLRVFFLLLCVVLGVRAEFDDVEKNEPLAEIDAISSETYQPSATTPLWQPAVGEKWQIILNSTIKLDPLGLVEPSNVKIFEVDLFDTPKSTIQELRSKGVKVICYF